MPDRPRSRGSESAQQSGQRRRITLPQYAAMFSASAKKLKEFAKEHPDWTVRNNVAAMILVNEYGVYMGRVDLYGHLEIYEEGG